MRRLGDKYDFVDLVLVAVLATGIALLTGSGVPGTALGVTGLGNVLSFGLRRRRKVRS